jgi:alpha/beta superfamily hydrolase
MTRVLANTVLPARREPVAFETADGVRLVGELALPETREPVATAITLHPLPTQGGSMESHLYRKMAWRLPAMADLAVLRFNTRGHDGSGGTFDFGNDERFDVAAALDLAESRDLPKPWLVGWSFGTDLVLRHGADPSIEGAILISPPLRFSTDADLDAWAAFGKPLVCLVPELDDYLRPDAARERFARVPQADIVAVPGAKHLWVGYAETVLNEIVKRLAPQAFPLPDEWPES